MSSKQKTPYGTTNCAQVLFPVLVGKKRICKNRDTLNKMAFIWQTVVTVTFSTIGPLKHIPNCSLLLTTYTHNSQSRLAIRTTLRVSCFTTCTSWTDITGPAQQTKMHGSKSKQTWRAPALASAATRQGPVFLHAGPDVSLHVRVNFTCAHDFVSWQCDR